MNKSLIVRILVLIVGLVIISYVVSSIVPGWLPYSDEIPFWYFTSDKYVNVGLTIAIAWTICALILWPLTAPTTVEEAGLAFIGYSFIAVGFGFVAPTRHLLFTVVGLNPMLGYSLMLLGVVAVIYSFFRWNSKWDESTDTTPEPVVASAALTKCENCFAKYVYKKENLNPDGSVTCQNCGSKIEHPNV